MTKMMMLKFIMLLKIIMDKLNNDIIDDINIDDNDEMKITIMDDGEEKEGE
jgi:hypothetical protein